jgi:hypothetical protein
MEQAQDLSNYRMYKLKTDSTIMVAVPGIYNQHISQLKHEYGSVAEIPSSKTVRGIFVKKDEKGQYSLVSPSAQENDVTINQLQEEE